MFDQLFPRPIDNTYRGYGAALRLFGLVVAVRIIQSVLIIFNGYSATRNVGCVPL
jgi:hypothetical protein